MHATKVKANDKASDKISIAQLATLFGLPDWDRVDDMNQETYWEQARGAENAEEAERAAQEEIYNQWYDAVESASTKLFEQHGLELQPTGKQGSEKRRFDFKIVPSKSWNDAADKIRETINGVGNFHFNNLGEFLRSGPYTAKQAVIDADARRAATVRARSQAAATRRNPNPIEVVEATDDVVPAPAKRAARQERGDRPVVIVTRQWNRAMMDDVIDAEIVSEQKLLA